MERSTFVAVILILGILATFLLLPLFVAEFLGHAFEFVCAGAVRKDRIAVVWRRPLPIAEDGLVIVSMDGMGSIFDRS